MTGLSWLAVLPAFLMAVIVLVVPGLIVLAQLRLGVAAKAALAGAVSVVAIGVAGMVFSALDLPFAMWQPLVVAVVAAAGVTLVRRSAPTLGPRGWSLAPLGGVWALAIIVIGLVAFIAVQNPALVSQTYDNVFHLSAVAAILEHGDASSLTLRTLIETDRSLAFYPSAWHSLVALVAQSTGAAIGLSANATWLAVCAVVWLPGVAWLSHILLPRFPPTEVALVALPLAAAFGAMPYPLLAWGALYPTFLATALLPVAVGLPVLGWRAWRAARASSRAWVLLWASGGTISALAAITFAQPRVLATWGLLMAVPFVAVVAGSVRRGWRAGGASRRRTGRLLVLGALLTPLTCAAGIWYLVTCLGLFERPLSDRLDGPQAQAVQPVWAGLWQVLSQSWLTGVGTSATWPSLLLAGAVMLGAVAAWRTRRVRWVVVAFALLAIMFALAAGSDDILTKLVAGLWYKDKYRLSSALPVLGVPLATLGVLTAVRWRRPQVDARRRVLASAVAWVVAGTSALTLALTGTSGAVAHAFRMPEVDAGDAVVSQRQAEFFGDLELRVPADQRVLGDPWDGSAWTLVFGAREPVFPHVNGQWDADRLTVAFHLADIESDPAVCAALDRLRVRYVVHDPHEFGGGDPSGNHFPGPHAAVDAGLLTLVESAGTTGLYRIDQCGALE
ncbi:DUF6541 family protein [Microbacterium sp. ZW T2_14]|uniref:DUF6541 family protein n=1 Tax=Microbacterium sp. ZW T2_14 TaxID=3378079 RepID=UPI0038554D9F